MQQTVISLLHFYYIIHINHQIRSYIMKKLFTIIIVFANIAFANECERLYQAFVSHIPGQNVTVCRVNVEGRTDVIGMYFTMSKRQTVLLYGRNYDTMMYSADDPYVANAQCINDNQYRIISRYMTGSEIAEKLLRFKKCEVEYRTKHDPKRNNHWVMMN